MSDWRWYYNNDLSGPSTPFIYNKWGEDQPNNWGGNQDVLTLLKRDDFDFNDAEKTENIEKCFLCECP